MKTWWVKWGTCILFKYSLQILLCHSACKLSDNGYGINFEISVYYTNEDIHTLSLRATVCLFRLQTLSDNVFSVAFFVYSSNEDATPGLQLPDARAIQVTVTTEMFSQRFLTKQNIIFSQAKLTRNSQVSQFSSVHEGKNTRGSPQVSFAAVSSKEV